MESTAIVRVDFDPAHPSWLREAIERRIYFLSESIVNFDLVELDEGQIVGVILHVDSPPSDLASNVNAAIRSEVAGARNVPPKRVWEVEGGHVADGPTAFNELCKRGSLGLHGDGQVSLSGPYARLVDIVDSIFGTLAREVFRGTEYRFPTLLPTETLRKAGYLDSFPNLVFLVDRVTNESENYEKFKALCGAHSETDRKDVHSLEPCRHSGFCLPPTVCYYVYDMLSGTATVADSVITAQGRSFRFENRYRRSMERLWDFTIRETVFLGSQDFVIQQLTRFRQACGSILRGLGMGGFCETADDPFFLIENAGLMTSSQRMVGSKHEMRLFVDGTRTIACGSFNFHGQQLGERFELTDGRLPTGSNILFTGCVGIGLERFVYSVFAQLGIEADGWPEPLSMARSSLDVAAIEQWVLSTVGSS